MTAIREYEFTCACGADFTGRLYESINVTEHPEALQQIIDGHFNIVVCPKCNTAEYIEKVFLYHDMDRGLLVFVYPEHKEDEWNDDDEKAMLDMAKFLHQLNGGEGAGPEFRVVFGMESLRELILEAQGKPLPAEPVHLHHPGCGCGGHDESEAASATEAAAKGAKKTATKASKKRSAAKGTKKAPKKKPAKKAPKKAAS